MTQLRSVADTEERLFPIVETADGKVRGLRSGGICIFKGVSYAADTSGKRRFLPPQPVRPWAGVRDVLNYGQISPQIPGDRRRDYADLIMNDYHPGGMGEDCLVLNIWTPSTDPSAKRPVLVRFHGGGFYGGSANAPGMDGEKLSRFGDCVVVGVNHRLSAFGYLYLGDEGEFADSGAAGASDLVAALQWVSHNIAAFGGDPGRVLIFGQSGGGAKVSHLMAMPSATGLFHRAGIMSGSRLTAMTRENAAKASDQLLAKLAVNRRDISQLQSLPFTTILAAQAEVEAADRARGEAPRSFAPVLGDAVPRHPFRPNAPPMSAHIPLIVGTVLDERTYREANFDMTWDQARKALQGLIGDKTEDVLTLYRDDDPKASPYLVHARVITDRTFRLGAHQMADHKAAQAKAGGAPVWTYLWTEPSPAYGGRYGATHAVDNAPSMHDIRFPLSGPNATNARLADELAGAWVSFAATGDPNNRLTPAWPAYDEATHTTMVFANPSAAVHDPRARIREYWGRK